MNETIKGCIVVVNRRIGYHGHPLWFEVHLGDPLIGMMD